MLNYLRNKKKYAQFIIEYLKFKKLLINADAPTRFSMNWSDRWPCLYDKIPITGFDSHYIYHTAWAARILNTIKPDYHVDISSSLYFSCLVSAFIPVRFYDYRPAHLNLSNLTSESADLLSLPFSDNSIDSLSSMHVVEHVGLGRYGDPFDPDGDLKAISELKRVLSKDGSFLFVVPIGKPKIAYNAHRIYSYDQITDYFSELKLMEFALITDNPDEGIISSASKEQADMQSYGCGCFWFKKI